MLWLWFWLWLWPGLRRISFAFQKAFCERMLEGNILFVRLILCHYFLEKRLQCGGRFCLWRSRSGGICRDDLRLILRFTLVLLGLRSRCGSGRCRHSCCAVTTKSWAATTVTNSTPGAATIATIAAATTATAEAGEKTGDRDKCAKWTAKAHHEDWDHHQTAEVA